MVAAERQIMEAEYDENADDSTSGVAFFRSVALVVSDFYCLKLELEHFFDYLFWYLLILMIYLNFRDANMVYLLIPGKIFFTYSSLGFLFAGYDVYIPYLASSFLHLFPLPVVLASSI